MDMRAEANFWCVWVVPVNYRSMGKDQTLSEHTVHGKLLQSITAKNDRKHSMTGVIAKIRKQESALIYWHWDCSMLPHDRCQKIWWAGTISPSRIVPEVNLYITLDKTDQRQITKFPTLTSHNDRILCSLPRACRSLPNQPPPPLHPHLQSHPYPTANHHLLDSHWCPCMVSQRLYWLFIPSDTPTISGTSRLPSRSHGWQSNCHQQDDKSKSSLYHPQVPDPSPWIRIYYIMDACQACRGDKGILRRIES